ncbi:TPA: hypothetical protein EYP70_07250 [Candidatus Bathyarchaeota archaeon]|nr:hypothetical protein [Candidatus Bathyarchaeota archaeon]
MQNITKRIIRLVNTLVGYYTEPYVNMFETGYKAAKILFSILNEEIITRNCRKKIPMITSGNLRVSGGCLLERFFKEARILRKNISISIFPGNHYIDSPEL